MFRKTVSSIMMSLRVLGTLAWEYNIQPVKASGTVYIRADWSIHQPTAPVRRDGDTYTFTDNVYDSIVVEREE